jgi:hypothetical protein
MKVIAYYLPQFHEIEENNRWWGEGFTEWTNVKNGKPLFKNHYQPRVPLNENYYDLSNPDTIRWQSKIAKENGVYGFCFYHYWFNGKLLLEKPAELLLSNPDIDIHYCFCWANENWTNGWVSSDAKILISHDNSDKKDWIIHIDYLLRFFKDQRYIKINGMPVVVLYYPPLLQKCEEMIKVWKEKTVEAGFPGLVVIYQQARYFFQKTNDKAKFDYGMEFMPGFFDWAQKSQQIIKAQNLWIKTSSFLQKNFHLYLHKKRKQEKLEIQDFDKTWNWYLNKYTPNGKTIANAFVGWDNTPRKGIKGSVYLGSTPSVFSSYLEKLILKNQKKYPLNCIFIFAWNEWGEGGYLEPDEKFKYGYLEAIKEALEKTNELPMWTKAGSIEFQKR